MARRLEAAVIAPLINQVVETLRKRRIEKATITLPSGAKIEVDKASAAEIAQVIAASQPKPRPLTRASGALTG